MCLELFHKRFYISKIEQLRKPYKSVVSEKGNVLVLRVEHGPLPWKAEVMESLDIKSYLAT